MRRGVILTGLLTLVVVILVGQQCALPPLLERAVDKRLTERGGEVEVGLAAFPAFRLLFGEGHTLAIEGAGIEVDLEADNDVFGRLEGFDGVDIDLTDVTSGPFKTQRFVLSRPAGQDEYELILRSMVTGRDLSQFAAGRLPGPLGDLASGLAGLAPGISDAPLPVSLDATLAVEDGSVRIVDGAGTVAGIPAGPVVEAIAGAILSQL